MTLLKMPQGKVTAKVFMVMVTFTAKDGKVYGNVTHTLNKAEYVS